MSKEKIDLNKWFKENRINDLKDKFIEQGMDLEELVDYSQQDLKYLFNITFLSISSILIVVGNYVKQ